MIRVRAAAPVRSAAGWRFLSAVVRRAFIALPLHTRELLAWTHPRGAAGPSFAVPNGDGSTVAGSNWRHADKSAAPEAKEQPARRLRPAPPRSCVARPARAPARRRAGPTVAKTQTTPSRPYSIRR